MPVTGRYLARRVRRGVAVYLATYVTMVQNEVLPVFANLEAKANRISVSEFDRLKAQSLPFNFDDELGSLAERAQETSEVYYKTMDSLHRSTITLYAVGLFHLVEQNLADLCRDRSFGIGAPKDTKIEEVGKWFKNHFNLDLKTLDSWGEMDELRLLANTAKHGNGPSAVQLRKVRPDLFENPQIRELLPESPGMYTSSNIYLPLAGQDLFVSEDIFAAYGASAFEFACDIARHFESKSDDLYFTNC